MKNLLFCFLLLGCGMNGTQHIAYEGGVTANIDVNLTFIEQIRQMCQDSILRSSVASDEVWKQAIAQCTFKALSITSISSVIPSGTSVNYCAPNQDLSAFTPIQQANIIATCKALGL